ncbi:MAG TPA: N-acetylmannosamine-6-phosphate 2-epimerase [Candidatus Baltobacteraceae bacterium]|jgi:N-acylglucosamine-6-phosphate 2-epimerase|nr:N-acetylmannosamine-6-phosphate 2-epimerase [Candidatus Baltobacteraceae bacterium]
MSLLDELRGGLIVSVQAWPGSALDDPHVIAAMARAAQEGDAVGVRIQGVANLRAVRSRVEVPVVGLIKREYPGFEPYITPTLEEVTAIAGAGADVIAFDATARPRPGGTRLESLIEAIHAAGRLAMADCATLEEGRTVAALGADVVATTLCGYTPDTAGAALPALALVAALRQAPGDARRAFVVCEGGVHSPDQVRAALDAGADAVVVGTAITNVDWLVREFAGSTDMARNRSR